LVKISKIEDIIFSKLNIVDADIIVIYSYFYF